MPSKPLLLTPTTTQEMGTRLTGVVPRVLDLCFTRGSAKTWPRTVVAIALMAVGVFHWLWFFGSTPLAFDFEDWPKERAYLDVLREALTSHSVPFHMDFSLQMTTRFLAIPETMLGPQVVLLAWLTNTQFVTFQACFMFLIGLGGCWQLARRFDWSAFTFLTFTVVFSFNGFITARLAVGHFMWAGYYLFPWMLWVVLRLLEAPASS